MSQEDVTDSETVNVGGSLAIIELEEDLDVETVKARLGQKANQVNKSEEVKVVEAKAQPGAEKELDNEYLDLGAATNVESLNEKELAEKRRDVAIEKAKLAIVERDNLKEELKTAEAERDASNEQIKVVEQERDAATEKVKVAEEERDSANERAKVAEEERDSVKEKAK